MYEEAPAVPDRIIQPRPVGNVALSGAIGRVDVAHQLVVAEHSDQPKKPGVPDLLGPLSPEMQAWHTRQCQIEARWKRNVAAARYARGETDVPAPYRG